jgi:N-glycosidase YbiA
METTDQFFKTLPSVLPEPFFFLSILQNCFLRKYDLSHLEAHLPCWIPQSIISQKIFGQSGLNTLKEGIVARNGSWVWATEFSNVHQSFSFTEPVITINDVPYHGTEQYYQAQKSVGTPDELAVATLMEQTTDPLDSYRIGNNHCLREDWNAVKYEVMVDAVRAKFQCPFLQELLLSTGNHPLVQLKPSDSYWGTGYDGKGSYWGTGYDGKGLNMLGVILERLRDDLRVV